MSLSINKSNKFLEEVYAEKFKLVKTNFSASKAIIKSLIITLFPTPVSPITNIFTDEQTNFYIKYPYLVVSVVGTKILK